MGNHGHGLRRQQRGERRLDDAERRPDGHPGASANTDVEPEFSGVKVDSGGYGILACDYRTPQEAWAVGGGGTMYRSTDGGKTFKFDASADRIPGNLYTVKFFDDKTGFALGSDGVLMRYQG